MNEYNTVHLREHSNHQMMPYKGTSITELRKRLNNLPPLLKDIVISDDDYDMLISKIFAIRLLLEPYECNCTVLIPKDYIQMVWGTINDVEDAVFGTGGYA